MGDDGGLERDYWFSGDEGVEDLGVDVYGCAVVEGARERSWEGFADRLREGSMSNGGGQHGANDDDSDDDDGLISCWGINSTRASSSYPPDSATRLESMLRDGLAVRNWEGSRMRGSG